MEQQFDELQKEKKLLYAQLNKKKESPQQTIVSPQQTIVSPSIPPLLSLQHTTCPVCHIEGLYETVVCWKECGHRIIQQCQDNKIIPFLHFKKGVDLWFDK
jgi:hypothetical protein